MGVAAGQQEALPFRFEARPCGSPKKTGLPHTSPMRSRQADFSLVFALGRTVSEINGSEASTHFLWEIFPLLTTASSATQLQFDLFPVQSLEVLEDTVIQKLMTLSPIFSSTHGNAPITSGHVLDPEVVKVCHVWCPTGSNSSNRTEIRR